METTHHNPEISADKRADRLAFVYIAVFTFLSWAMLSNADHLESIREGLNVSWIEAWLTQGTSHIAILIVIAALPFFLSRFPLNLENWVRRVPLYCIGFGLFSAVHIILMMVFRTLTFPLLLDRPHERSLLEIDIWRYEMPKDAYTFLLVVSIFLTMRQMEQLRLEAASARLVARETGRLRLKSGGRILFLSTDEIVRAEAASNYVDIKTETGHHFIRMTLTSLERLIREAGHSHIRIHRSHLVKRNSIREISPKGDGKWVAKIENGDTVPVGQKYKSSLKAQAVS